MIGGSTRKYVFTPSQPPYRQDLGRTDSSTRWYGAHRSRRSLSIPRTATCVLVITPSTADAAALADDVATLERGKVSRPIGQPDLDQLVPGSPVELVVWCERPRVMAAALVREPSVLSLSLSGPDDGPDNKAVLRIVGMDGDANAAAVAKVALDEGIVVFAMRRMIPCSMEVNAATAGQVLAMLHHAAYQAAYQAASQAQLAREGAARSGPTQQSARLP